jgi:glycosyltransferase involved in cell wall biosynthesis
MIVKDEAMVIVKCLASIKDIVDHWVIVDTGSSDGTQKIIKDFLRDVPGELYERPWVDFAFNRNEAFSLAKDKGDYLLFIDADETLEFINSFSLPLLDKDYYVAILHNKAFLSTRILLVNSHFDWRWNGIIHEAVECPEAKNKGFLKHAIIRVTLEGNRSRDLLKKFRQDIELLESILQKDPQNSRYRLQLAQYYEAEQEYSLALKNYELRTVMGEAESEIFVSLYRMGLLQKRLNMSSEIFLNSYVKAFLLQPWRAEPLFFLVEYFININAYVLGYLVARFAVNVELVVDYYLISHEIYDYGLLYQYAECSFRMGKYQEAYESLKRLLAMETLPPDVRKVCEKNFMLLKNNGN